MKKLIFTEIALQFLGPWEKPLVFLGHKKSLWNFSVHKKSFGFFCVFFVFILNINLATASGIGISPDKLIFDKNNLEKEITIFNLNDYSTNYIISVKNNPDLFDFSEKNFAIEKNSSKKISIKINNPEENFEDIIYIRQFSNSNLLPGVGIKVIISKDKKFYDGKEIFIGSVILLVGVLAFVRFKYK